MSPLCPSWPSVEALQAGTLREDESAAARTHLASCLSCRREIEEGEALATRLRALDDPPAVDPEAWVKNLAPEIDRAVTQRGRFAGRAIAAAAAIAVAAGLAFFVMRGPGSSSPAGSSAAIVILGTGETISLGRTLETGAASLVLETPRKDVVTLAAASRARVTSIGNRTAFAVDRGRIDANVSKRATGEVFEVTTPHAAVAVIGTRFVVIVEGDATVVTVTEGVVAVRSLVTGAVERLVAGTSTRVGTPVEVAAAPSAPEPEAAGAPTAPQERREDPVAPLRSLVKARRWDEAAEGLQALLARDPNRHEARYLLGRVLQSRNDLRGAAEAFRTVATSGTGITAENASMGLAQLLAGRLADPAGALEEHGRYLTRHPRGVHRLEASFERCRLLVRLGRRDEARRSLEAFLTDYPAGYRAADAREMLDGLAGR